MLNLFALVSSVPSVLCRADDPVGAENDHYLSLYSSKADKVVCMWGNSSPDLNRNKKVLPMLKNPHYLKLNKSLEPAHPRYLSGSLKPIAFE